MRGWFSGEDLPQGSFAVVAESHVLGIMFAGRIVAVIIGGQVVVAAADHVHRFGFDVVREAIR